MSEPVTVWRVYESYHYPDESGTREYGMYTTYERALERAKAVWQREGYGEYRQIDGGGLCGGGLDWTAIYVQPVQLDVDANGDNVGYT